MNAVEAFSGGNTRFFASEAFSDRFRRTEGIRNSPANLDQAIVRGVSPK